jgi:cystathionine beta-lyase/cystathionine gamma-synthase
VGGVAVATEERLVERLRFVQNAVGAILSPFDSFLVLRGTKTLHLRMSRHEENACAVAPFLYQHPKVQAVHWPGLPDHPGHAVHRRQASGFGALVTFDLGSLEAAKGLLGRVRLCALGESLGGVETLVSHPATMSHAGHTPAERDALGITGGLVRISVGCEDAADIVADLDQALAGL